MNTRAYTLVEMILVLLIISISLMSVSGIAKGRIQRTRLERTADDLYQIGNMAKLYYRKTGNWPSSINDLSSDYSLRSISTNVFGYAFELTPQPHQLVLSTRVPENNYHPERKYSQMEFLMISGHGYYQFYIPSNTGINPRVRYENKYLY